MQVPSHGERAVDQPFVDPVGPGHLVVVTLVGDQHQVEVAVAHVTHDGRDQVVLLDVLLGLDDAFGQAADRHADVRRPHFRPRADRLRRIGRVVAHLPQLVALLLVRRPGERAAAPFVGDRLDHLRLFLGAGLGAVKLVPERRLHRQVGAGIVVERLHLHFVGQLDARHGNAHLDGLDDGIHRRLDGGIGAERGDHGFGNAIETEVDLRDHAERAFGADEEPRQVVAGRRLARPLRGLDHPPVGSHDGQAEHVLAHGAVADGVGAAGARRRHAADRGVRPRVDREHQAGVAEIFVQLLPRHARLHAAVQILGVDLQHLVHLGDVDGDAAVERRHMALQRGTGAEGNDRHLVLGAGLDDLLHLFRRMRVDHGVRRHHRVVVLALAVLLAHGLGGREAVAEALLQDCDGVVDARLGPVLDRAVNLQAHGRAPSRRALSPQVRQAPRKGKHPALKVS